MPTPTWSGRPGPREWPAGMRVIARRERPRPGAQLRLTDHNGWRISCFATNTKGPGWTLAALEVRHRQRARAEDRIRGLKDTGMRNLPFHGFAQNQIWLEIVALAADLLAWTQTLALGNRRRKDPDTGEWVDGEPTRHSCTAFGTLGDHIADSLTKGDRILIVGTVTTDVWADKDTDDKRTMQRVLVDAAGPSLRWATARIQKAQRTTAPHGTETD